MSILYPVLALFALTAFCVFRLALLRLRAVQAGRVDPRYYRVYTGGEEPEDLRVQARHVSNLFEAPVLFYAIAVIAFVTEMAGALPVLLAWTYVLLRYAHSYVHLTSNRVLLRFRVFAASWAVLILLWLTVFGGMVTR